MYRVLVVDDEAIITDSLAFMLQSQEEYELEVSKAYSAPEAMEMLECAAYHIVVSDIEMPGQSGLGLLRQIHEKWPSCQAVFLTGHDRFEYVQEALRYNVVRYVLKNEGDDILLEAIGECIRRIKKEQASIKYRLHTSTTGTSVAASWADARQGMDAQRGTLLMAGCTREPINGDTLVVLQAILSAKIGHAVCSKALLAGERLCIWFMQPAKNNSRTHALAAIKGLAEDIQETIRISMAVHITFVFAGQETPWDNVPAQLAHLQDLARNHLNAHKGLALVDARFFEEEDRQEEASAAGPAFVGQVLSHVRGNLGSDLSLTALSELVYLNPSYLSRRFKEVTGRNLADTILKLRIEEACRLLKNSSLRVKSIAVQVGYESAAHFSRVFKKEMGLTPQEYRDSIKG